MKKLCYFICFLAVAGFIVAPNVGATAYDPTGAPGNQPFPPPTAMINNHGMLGDYLYGDFYRAVVNDQFFEGSNVATYISIENVSNKYVAAHVRLRSGRFSIEVLDFPILLSPYDVFWFQFQAIPDPVTGELSAVQIISTDKHTIELSGLNTLSSIPGAVVTYDPDTGALTMNLRTDILEAFTSMDDEYKQLVEITQGYIEIIGLFAIDKINSGDNFYGVMSGLWKDSTGALIENQGPFASYLINDGLGTRKPALDVTKMLGGHVFIGDFQTGLYMGYTMKAIKDFRAGVGAHRDLCIRGPNNGGGVAVNPATIIYDYMNDAAYNAPDWATDFGPTPNDGDSTFGATLASYGPGMCDNFDEQVASFSLDEFDNALYKQELHTTFFNTGFSGQTYTLVSVLAPTKYLHWFWSKESGLNSYSPFTGNFWPVGSISVAYSVRSKINVGSVTSGIGNICVETYGIYDLEEHGYRISSPGVPFILPYELNFVPIGYESSLFYEDFCFLVNVQTTPFAVYASDFPSGHIWMDHFTYCDGVYNGDPRVLDGVYVTNDCGTYGCTSEDSYLLPLGGLPVSSLVMDAEGTNYPHARLFEPQWDNPVIEHEGVTIPPTLDLGYDGVDY